MEVVSLDARVEHVTVYARGACVRRTTSITAPVPRRVRIANLPTAVIEDTVRVEVEGPAIAVGVRVGLDAAAAADAAEEASAELRAAQRAVALAETEVERLDGALEQLAATRVIEPDRSDDPPPPWSAVVAARTSVVAARTARELALRERHAAARRELDEARRVLQAVTDRDRRASTARAPKLHETRKYVELELVPSADGAITIHVEYQVAAARWAPSYVARLDGGGRDEALVEIRAIVAQETGEDWSGVPLRLSTAEPARFATLPELAAQRIGRRQHDAVRGGFRPPPTGVDALFADYDRSLPKATRRRSESQPQPIRGDEIADRVYVGRPPSEAPLGGIEADAELAGEVWDEQSSRAKEAFRTPPSSMAYPSSAPPPPPGIRNTARGIAPAPGMPMLPPAQAAFAGAVSKKRSMERARGGGAPEGDARSEAMIAAAPVARLDYGNLRMAPASSPARGTLIPAEPPRGAETLASDAAAAAARVQALALPPGCSDDWAHTYDYAFATDGAVDVRADGAWHSIPVTSRATTSRLRHVTVPREQPDVFRIATLANPFAGPLLPGPIDVYDRGRFLVTSKVDYTPPSGNVEVGLGVDAGVKVARNTEFREEAAGMLRGALRLLHGITIDVDNLSARSIDLEVRERIPVTTDGDDSVEVTLGRVEPAWERWTPDADGPRDERLRGGHRWRVTVPAGQKRQLRAAYEVRIANKLEVVGGNRREA